MIGRDGVGSKKEEKSKAEPNGFHMNGKVEPEKNEDNTKIRIDEDENMNGGNYHANSMANNHYGQNEKILI